MSLTKSIALLDGDLFVFESATRGETRMDFGDGEVIQSDLPTAIHNLKARIDTAMKAADCTEVRIAFSCPSRRYFRHDIFPTYKSGRTGPRPVVLADLRKWVESEFRCRHIPNLEADDVLGIFGTDPLFRESAKCSRVVIVSGDKDLDQIPGEHLNHNKLDRGVYTIDANHGDWFHHYQTLVGDTCDTYPGCPRIGPVKATKLLGGKPDWKAVVGAFVKAGKTEADALVQARVSRILRHGEYDFHTKEVKLWQPCTPGPSKPKSVEDTRTPR